MAEHNSFWVTSGSRLCISREVEEREEWRGEEWRERGVRRESEGKRKRKRRREEEEKGRGEEKEG